MKYTYPIEEYTKQLKAYNELESMTFSPEESRESVIARLEERSAQKRVIADIANTMIREYVETFEKDPEALTDADAETLDAFADLLSPDGSTARAVGVTDYAIYFRIARILLGYYRRIGDPNRYVFALNRCSNGHTHLVNGHCFAAKDALYLDECIALAKQYLDSDELDEKARTKLFALLAREVITGEEHFPADRFRYIYDLLRSHAHAPRTQYETLCLLFFSTTILQLFREHCIWAKDHGVSPDIESAKPLIRELCGFLRDMIAENPGLGGSADIMVFLLSAEYFTGDISLDGLLDKITELQRTASDSPDPITQTQALGLFNHLYLNTLYRYSDAPKEEIARRSRERVREVLPKLLNVTRQVNNVMFNRNIVEFLNAASLTGSFDEFALVILESTVYADKALYIHTEMVREMSRAIFDYMIEVTPEAFDGVAGKYTAYIRAHKDEMKRLLDDCCMFHDIGKFFMLDIVENSMRRLTDDEFEIIKEHPEHFEHIYQIIDDRDERVLCIRDCALTHHLWHDGTRGYPLVPNTANRPFVDVLAIADSIDAATDFLGRPYHSGKTIDELIREFQAEAGTHYGPKAAAALSAPEVRDRLHYWITEGRKEIYYRIYTAQKP